VENKTIAAPFSLLIKVPSTRALHEIEVLYVPNCPNHAVALERLREVLAGESLEAHLLAGLLADISSEQRVPARQPPLVSVATENFDQLRTAFNKASGDVRVILLLSPT
jgi:hypothetical protein